MTGEEDNTDRPPGAAPRKKVSAIVVTYFTGPLLARSVASLAAQPEVGEIVVVDNGNFAGDVEKALEGSVAEISSVLTGHGNIGFAAACNLGAKKAQHDILLFLNPDAVIPDGGMAHLLAHADTVSEKWLIAPRLIDPDGTEQQGSRRTTLTPWRAFVEATRLYKLAPRHPYFQRFNLHAEDCPEEIFETPTISGACFMISRANYWSIDGMDEHYFLHVEDIDFCLRHRKAGGRVYFDPNVSVTHFKSSSRANPITVEARKTSSMIRYFRRHFSDAYPAPFLWLVAGALWFSFGLLFIRRAVAKAFRMVGIRLRGGRRAAERARSISSRHSSR